MPDVCSDSLIAFQMRLPRFHFICSVLRNFKSFCVLWFRFNLRSDIHLSEIVGSFWLDIAFEIRYHRGNVSERSCALLAAEPEQFTEP